MPAGPRRSSAKPHEHGSCSALDERFFYVPPRDGPGATTGEDDLSLRGRKPALDVRQRCSLGSVESGYARAGIDQRSSNRRAAPPISAESPTSDSLIGTYGCMGSTGSL